MKTPYQIAKELNISPQAIYKRLTPTFNNQFNNHIQRNPKGKYLLDPVAERALKDLYNVVAQPVVEPTIEPVEQPLLNQLNTENSFLREQNAELQAELIREREHSRAQAERLTALAEQVADLARNNQILLGVEQRRTALTDGAAADAEVAAAVDEPKPPKKRGIFGLFKKMGAS